MPFNLAEFIAEGLKFGGARPSLFQVILTPPPAIGASQPSIQKFSFTCQAAQLPASNVSQIEVPYFGRKIKVAGERTFDNWTVSVMNDEDFQVRALFEMWSNALNALESNVRQQDLDAENYKAILDINQYAKNGDIIRSYQIIGAFPTDVSAIETNWNSTGTIETFNVTFAYDYWLPLFEGTLGGLNSYEADT